MSVHNDEGDCLRMQGREWAAKGIDMVESRIPMPGEVKYGLLNDHIHPFIYCLCALFLVVMWWGWQDWPRIHSPPSKPPKPLYCVGRDE